MDRPTFARRLIRRALPLEFRQSIAQARRLRSDRFEGLSFQQSSGGDEWPIRIALSQPIMPSPVFDAKMKNLRRGAALVNRSLIPGSGGLIQTVLTEPGKRPLSWLTIPRFGSKEAMNRIAALFAPHESGGSPLSEVVGSSTTLLPTVQIPTWSFWHAIGRPTARNGFAPGRNIVEGTVVRQIGGGLCQLSSLLYHLALLGGLAIVERHHHSVDIYEENARFTPLGADATVVWGYKDLRLANPHPFDICIGCAVEDDRLIGYIRSPEVIEARDLIFLRDDRDHGSTLVTTIIDGDPTVESRYERGV